MLNPATSGAVLLLELLPCPPALLALAAAAAGAPLQRVARLEQALAIVQEEALRPALLMVVSDATEAVAAVTALVAAGAPPPLLLAAGAPAAFPSAACYQAGAADVLALELAPYALERKLQRFAELARHQSARAGAEHALRDARGHLHSTAVAAGLAMWSWDIASGLVHVDGAMRQLFDLTEADSVSDARADAATVTVGACLRALHPDDDARARADVARALASGAPYESALRVLARDGRYRHLLLRGELLTDADGRPRGLRGAARDVTGAREAQQALDASEERYRTLFDAVDEGVCIIEMIRDQAGEAVDYRFLETNPAFVRHTGLADAVGKTILELVPDHDPVWMKLYGGIARSGVPARYQNDSAGAMQRWFDVYATPVGGAGSDRVAVLFTDISERKEAQLELQRLAADLTEANRRKNDFIATLAHELRNPLAPLRSGLPLLRLAGEDGAARERVLATMERQLGHLVDLVDDLLDVARITHGQIALKSSVVEIAGIVAAAVEAARPAIEARRHRLQIDIEGRASADDEASLRAALAAPMLVRGDPTRLTQVLGNLLNNAAKYTGAGGQLRLALRRQPASAAGADAVVIEVSDNGVGIAADALDEVFQMFNQVGRADGADDDGLGIGLSLVRSLVEQHGGSVSAASPGPGLGSTFTVRLPLEGAAATPLIDHAGDDPAVDFAADFAHDGTSVPVAPRGHAVRVLVVDDNSDAAAILAELLELLGHTAQVANNGADALEAMLDFRPQVVLLDLGMPQMNGYQVAAAIRNNHRFDQPLLAALTGWGGQQDRDRTRAAGFDLHLTKPVDLAVIERVLAAV